VSQRILSEGSDLPANSSQGSGVAPQDFASAMTCRCRIEAAPYTGAYSSPVIFNSFRHVTTATGWGTLIDDLLGFSRLGRKSLAAVKIDMTALAQGVGRDQRA
jgi:hypothetical protein